jgi:hypothetical protein
LLSDSFKETVKSFFFNISANFPAQCTRADMPSRFQYAWFRRNNQTRFD